VKFSNPLLFITPGCPPEPNRCIGLLPLVPVFWPLCSFSFFFVPSRTFFPLPVRTFVMCTSLKHSGELAIHIGPCHLFRVRFPVPRWFLFSPRPSASLSLPTRSLSHPQSFFSLCTVPLVPDTKVPSLLPLFSVCRVLFLVLMVLSGEFPPVARPSPPTANKLGLTCRPPGFFESCQRTLFLRLSFFFTSFARSLATIFSFHKTVFSGTSVAIDRNGKLRLFLNGRVFCSPPLPQLPPPPFVRHHYLCLLLFFSPSSFSVPRDHLFSFRGPLFPLLGFFFRSTWRFRSLFFFFP